MSARTVGEAQALGLRLFLEGLEVPIISATIDINEGAAAVAQIEIVGLDSAMRFKPRTVVHLFFFDGADYKYGDTGTEDSHYRLLFMGELFSYTYQKSGSGSRSVILNCIDFSNYWDTSFIFQVSGEEGLLDVPQIQPFITGSDLFVNNFVEQNIGLLLSQLSTESGGPQLPQSVLPGAKVEFLSSLMGVLEMLGGVSILDDSKPPTKDNPKATRYSVHGGLTPWHTLSERRVRLLDQIATDDGKTAANMFKRDKFEQFLKRQSDLTSSVLSFRDILSVLLGHVYYSTFPNPCGRLLRGEAVTPRALPAANVPNSNSNFSYTEGSTYALPTGAPLPFAYTEGGGSVSELTQSRLDVEEDIAAGDFAVSGELQFLSPSFPWLEMTKSPSRKDLQAQNRTAALPYYNFLRDLCIYILEPLREQFAAKDASEPFSINCAFRGEEYNESVGGVPTSHHRYGRAADLGFKGVDPWEAFKWLAFSDEIPYGELFYERGSGGGVWIHVTLGEPWGVRRCIRIGTYDTELGKTVLLNPTADFSISSPKPR